MRGACGIDVDVDKTFISFVAIKRKRLSFLEEVGFHTNVSSGKKGWGHFLSSLKHNSDALINEIRNKETKYSFRIGKVFLTLPSTLVHRAVVEEAIPLRKRKKITSRDLLFAKKYLENIFLEWDDFCIHHFVLQYEVEGEVYTHAPLGVWAKKIKLKSHFIWVKDKFRKEVEGIFINLDRDFGGFVAGGVSSIATALSLNNRKRRLGAIKIGYQNSSLIIMHSGKIEHEQEFDFGLERVFQSLGEGFSFPFELAQEIFSRYISFKSLPRFNQESIGRELSLRRGDQYVHLNTHTMNSFVKKYIRNEITGIVERLREKMYDPNIALFFVGRLNEKEGFGNFLREFIPYSIQFPFHKESSSSFGCVRYGLSPFLERDEIESQSVFQKALHICKEYF
ncbi:MAG: hypothetical protein JSW40_07390 [Candidatus Omnitrophota bacterium]|nr:MAG: hypothetical protein JSW40_07390 [Candidatus Omnitrophota bacterium]